MREQQLAHLGPRRVDRSGAGRRQRDRAAGDGIVASPGLKRPAPVRRCRPGAGVPAAPRRRAPVLPALGTTFGIGRGGVALDRGDHLRRRHLVERQIVALEVHIDRAGQLDLGLQRRVATRTDAVVCAVMIGLFSYLIFALGEVFRVIVASPYCCGYG